MIKVACLATKRPSGAQNMFATLKKLHWAFDVIGLSMKWTGFRTKTEAYLQYAQKQHPETLIVFVDCFDALAVRDPKDFEDAFRSFHAAIVVGSCSVCSIFNCEKVDKYWKKWHDDTNAHDHGNLYVNTGFVAGKARSLVKMYQWCVDRKIADDQIAVCRYMNERPEEDVALDPTGKLIYNDDTDWNPKGTHYDVTTTKNVVVAVHKELRAEPFFIHFPGFLIKRTAFGFLRPKELLPLSNYDLVGKHILGDDFVEVGQLDMRAYRSRNIISWGMFTLILLLILLLALSPFFYRR